MHWFVSHWNNEFPQNTLTLPNTPKPLIIQNPSFAPSSIAAWNAAEASYLSKLSKYNIAELNQGHLYRNKYSQQVSAILDSHCFVLICII